MPRHSDPERTEHTRHSVPVPGPGMQSNALTSTAIMCAEPGCCRVLRLENHFNSLDDLQTITPALYAAAELLGWTFAVVIAHAKNPVNYHYCPTHTNAVQRLSDQLRTPDIATGKPEGK